MSAVKELNCSADKRGKLWTKAQLPCLVEEGNSGQYSLLQALTGGDGSCLTQWRADGAKYSREGEHSAQKKEVILVTEKIEFLAAEAH